MSNQFLKRLELIGFKSFANKTILDFPGGIVAVVGPNGSGKSNIVDAFRWVLGEREAKQLRSDKLENLIFAGSPKKAAVGLAQVTLHFDNQNKVFPLDFEEVVVSRKADRSGASEYYLNKSEVRLKELTGLMAQARLGTKGLLIINQGNSDVLIKSSPADRRAMVEEVIGLRQYQLKKAEAERKLESTGFNLEKARAMIEEIKPHLKFLRRQTSRYEHRQEIANELNSLEDSYFRSKLAVIKQEADKISSQLRILDDSFGKESAEVEKLDKELKKLEDSKPGQALLKDIRDKHQKLRAEQSAIHKELGRLEGRLEYAAAHSQAQNQEQVVSVAKAIQFVGDIKEKIESWLSESILEKIREEISALSQKIENFLNPRSGFKKENGELNTLLKEKDKFLKDLEALDNSIKDLLTQETKLTNEFESFNSEFRKAYEAVESRRQLVNKIENEKNNLLFQKQRMDFQYQELMNQAREWGRTSEEVNSLRLEEQSLENVGEAERKMMRLRGELAAIGEIDEASLKEAKETEERYQFLSQQIEDLEKASADLKTLISELKEKINNDFKSSLQAINEEFAKYFRLMFGGGKARFKTQVIEKKVQPEDEEAESSQPVQQEDKKEVEPGLEIDLSLPQKRIKGLDSLSGGERSLVSLAALFALIAINPPPFLILDEIDAPLDEANAKRFSNLLKEFAHKTQFIVVTHNRSTMEAANVLYGVTMGDDGVSKVLSLKLDSKA